MLVNGINEINTRETILSAFPTAIVCLESALVDNESTSYLDKKPCIYFPVDNVLDEQLISLVPNKFGDKDIIEKNGRRFSNIERTICEMILYDRREDMIVEVVDEYINWMTSAENAESILKDKAKEYGVADKLQYFIDCTEDLYDY